MCGRYVSSRDPAELVREFDVDEVAGKVDESPLSPDYNVAPTKSVYAVVARSQDEQSDPVRRLTTLRWGLVPSWAKDVKIGNRLINARIETAASKPSFRRAWAKRRAILPADGYFEWYQPEQPGARKIPFYVHARDGGVLGLAGLYEIWRDDSKAEDDPAAWLWTATVLTTASTDDAGRLHDRAPLLVDRDHTAAWLDPAEPHPDVERLLTPAIPGPLAAYPVSTAVNNVRNNGAELIAPADPAGTDANA